MGFLAPESCPASFPEIFWTFSVFWARGLFGAFSRSSSLYFFSSSVSDSLPREQISRRISYPFMPVEEKMTLTRGDGKGHASPCILIPTSIPSLSLPGPQCEAEHWASSWTAAGTQSKACSLYPGQSQVSRTHCYTKQHRPWAQFHEASLISALQIKWPAIHSPQKYFSLSTYTSQAFSWARHGGHRTRTHQAPKGVQSRTDRDNGCAPKQSLLWFAWTRVKSRMAESTWEVRKALWRC